MFELFYQGGALFMGTLTLILTVILALGAYTFFNKNPELTLTNRTNLIRSVGLFALIVGILGQLIGLFSAFQYIEKVGQISPQMLAGGIRVSMITTMYGILIFLIAYLVSFALQVIKGQRELS